MGAARRPRVPGRGHRRNRRSEHLDANDASRYRAAVVSWPDIAFLSPVPIATALIALWEWYA